MAAEPDPPFPIELEVFLATVARVAATHGDATSVALLTASHPALSLADTYSDYGVTYYSYTLRLHIAPDIYAKLEDGYDQIVERLAQLTSRISKAHDEYKDVNRVALVPALLPADGWRESARAWLRGEGINNQGRVRSDNIATRQHDGLLFRSEPEIQLYEALKSRGVFLAPLPVFIRGGKTYERLEPDFVLVDKGVVMIVEVDGATVHRETPAEAHTRTQGLAHHGVRVERVKAEDCATRAGADRCAQRLVEALDRYRVLGR